TKKKISMIKKYALLFLLLTGFAGRTAHAQESLMTDMSYLFLEKLIATAKENYPRLKSFEKRVDVAKTAISREQLSWLNAFSFSYVYNPNNTLNFVDPNLYRGYQIGVNVNLAELLQKPGNVKRARTELDISRHELDEYHLSLEAEVKKRYYTYLQALNILRLHSKLTEEALGVSQDARIRYERSEITFEQFSMSQITYSNAQVNKINAEANFLSAKAAI